MISMKSQLEMQTAMNKNKTADMNCAFWIQIQILILHFNP